jgi:gamma-glutamyltranspeptidase
MILGYLMYRSRLVPRGMAMLGLIGGPLLVAAAIAVMFDVIDHGSAVQAVATIPEALWELSFGIYLIVKGFRPSPILAELDSGLVARGASA